MKRKIRKYKGCGMDASKKDFNVPSTQFTPSPGDTGGQGGPGYVGPSNKGSNIKNKVVAAGNTTKRLSLGAIPFTPAGFIIKGLTAVENQRRAKRAKGEYYLTNKKILPINRDFYRQYGRTLDTKIGSADT